METETHEKSQVNDTEVYLDYFSDQIKEDREACFFVFEAVLSKDTGDPQNVFFKGPSSIGKTWVIKNTVNLFNQQHIWMLGGLSPTALIHDYGFLVDVGGSEIDFSLKPSFKEIKEEMKICNPSVSDKQVKTEFWNQMKTWNAKLKDSYYMVDLHNKLLVFLEAPHIDTFNKLRPILSHDKEEISYRFTDKDKSGGLRTTHVKISGWPAAIFCTTEEKYLQDLATRSLTITPRTDDKKLRASCILIGEAASLPPQNGSKKEAVMHIKLCNLQDQIKNFDCVVPYARQLGENVPLYLPRVMRDLQHILTYIKLNALINHENRPKIVGFPKTVVLATLEDFLQVMEYFKYCEETTISGLGLNILTVFHKAIEPLGTCTYQKLVEKCEEVLRTPLSSSSLYVYVRELAKVGYVSEEFDPDDKRRKIIKVIKKQENLLYSLRKQFGTFFKLENWKEWLNKRVKTLHESLNLSNTFLEAQKAESPKPNLTQGFLALQVAETIIPSDRWDNDVEEMFNAQYVLDKCRITCNNIASPTETPLPESTVQETGNSNVRHSKVNLAEPYFSQCYVCAEPIWEDDWVPDETTHRPCHRKCAEKLKEGLKLDSDVKT